MYRKRVSPPVVDYRLKLALKGTFILLHNAWIARRPDRALPKRDPAMLAQTPTK